MLLRQEINFVNKLLQIQLKLCQVLLSIHGVDQSPDHLLDIFDHQLHLECLFLLMSCLPDLLLDLSSMLLNLILGLSINYTTNDFTFELLEHSFLHFIAELARLHDSAFQIGWGWQSVHRGLQLWNHGLGDDISH